MRTPLMNLLLGERGTQIFLAVLLVTAIVVPILHLAFDAGSSLHLSSYTMTLIGKYMNYEHLLPAVPP
ncbi:MAG TPA: hypothetical protein PKE27_23085, partial [Povalibacter sp.]|nr:hypothetical protein [Povalibacter sp.]